MIIDQLKNVQSGFYPNLLSAQGGNPGLAQRIQAAFDFLQNTDLDMPPSAKSRSTATVSLP